MRPLNWHTEPGVGTAPPARTYQDIRKVSLLWVLLAHIEELIVYLLYLLCHESIVGSAIVAANLHIHHIADALYYAVTQRVMGAQ